MRRTSAPPFSCGHDRSSRNTRPQLTLNKQQWKAHKQAMHVNDKPRRFKLHTTACYTGDCARTLVHYERLYCNVTLGTVLVKRAAQLSQLLELPSSRGPRLWLQWTAVNPWTHVIYMYRLLYASLRHCAICPHSVLSSCKTLTRNCNYCPYSN